LGDIHRMLTEPIEAGLEAAGADETAKQRFWDGYEVALDAVLAAVDPQSKKEEALRELLRTVDGEVAKTGLVSQLCREMHSNGALFHRAGALRFLDGLEGKDVPGVRVRRDGSQLYFSAARDQA